MAADGVSNSLTSLGADHHLPRLRRATGSAASPGLMVPSVLQVQDGEVHGSISPGWLPVSTMMIIHAAPLIWTMFSV